MSNSNTPPMTYKPTWVANSFLVRAWNESVQDIDPLKIQKLTYMLHGWYLAVYNTPVIGEQFEPWPHGPVNSTLYHKFKSYGFRPIRDYAKDVDPQTAEPAATYVGPSDTRFYEVFDRVWDRYKGHSGSYLSDLTHAEGTPWSEARRNGWQYIPNALIRDHYISLSKQAA